MHATELLVVAAAVLAFSLVSERLRRSPITAPLAFLALGLLVGPSALGLFHPPMDVGWTHGLAELTLALVLFGDATRIDLRALRREAGLPLRLLGVGLPLTVLAGTAIARIVVPELSVWEAALIAVMLAPTDAALGQVVVSSELVPLRLRQALNVESGLNDGLVLPLVLLLAACAGTFAGGRRRRTVGVGPGSS